MDKIIKQFSDIIVWHNRGREVKKNRIEQWVKIRFIDNSKLQVFERLDKLSDKYSYQWMNEDNTLIIR